MTNYTATLEETTDPYPSDAEEEIVVSNNPKNAEVSKRGFDPLVDHNKFYALKPSIPPALEADLNLIAELIRGTPCSINGNHLSALIAIKGFNYTSANIVTFFPLGSAPELTEQKNLEIIRRSLRDIGLNLTAVSASDAYIWDNSGILARVFHQIESTNIYYYFTGAQAIVERLHTALAENSVINHPPAVNRFGLDDRGNIFVTLKRLVEVKDEETWHAFYPYFDFTPMELWDQFNASRANTVFIYGEPGLGKSSFIRAMMDRRGYDNLPYLVDDENILEHRRFISYLNDMNYGSLLVSEDSDNLVRKRENQNSQMTGLLNTGEGISSGGLKMIISTNLKNLGDVDEALYRPGRTFRKLRFELLTAKQANVAREAIGLPGVNFNQEKVSLATALNWEATLEEQPVQTFGFRK